METTTSEVVRGARLAQDAGVALEEIENVSKNLAELIQNISNAARRQASSAGHISNTMNVIQEITSQTSAGTTATAKSIGNLAEMANQLRESVAGFKLPESGLGDQEALAAAGRVTTYEPTVTGCHERCAGVGRYSVLTLAEPARTYGYVWLPSAVRFCKPAWACGCAKWAATVMTRAHYGRPPVLVEHFG